MREARVETTLHPPAEITRIDQLVGHWAEARPEAVALRATGERRTYRELDTDIDAVAAALRDLRVGSGDRVLVLLENGLAAVVAVLAACRLGAWAVPVNARLSTREITAIREHAQPLVTLYTLRSSPAAREKALAEGATTLAVAGGLDIGFRAETVEPLPTANHTLEAGRDRIAALLYTSGTTGAPKGVMLSHANLLFVAQRTSAIRQLAPDDLAYLVLPISHVFGLAAILLGYLYCGVPVLLVPRFDPAAVAALAEDGITAFSGVPAMYAHLISLAERRGGRLLAPQLRYASIGGAPVDLALKRQAEAALGVPIYNGYGLTETSPSIATTRIGDERDDESVGTLLDDVELCIVGDDGTRIGQGPNIGEIWVRGGLVMRGYYRDPAGTAAVLTPDGWFRTGDLGRQSTDGHLFVVGRLKDLIIRSGFNVYPVEVEGVLAAYPGVALCAALGRPRDGNEEVVAFVEPRPGAALDVGALTAFAADRLAPYKRPSEYILRAALPVTPSGKVLRHRLRGELEP